MFAVQEIEKNEIGLFCFEKSKSTLYKFKILDENETKKWIESIQENVFGFSGKMKKRKIAFFMNPFSGGGKSTKIFEKEVEPILKVAHLEYKVFLSEKPAHITELASKIDINEYDGWASVGGDGTFFELLQGIMSRKDWKEATQRVFGVIPCGTSNGLCASIGAFSPAEAAFVIARGRYQPLDIASVIQKDKRYYSFLSITWALIADIDLGGDEYRWMGKVRVPVNAIVRGAVNKDYEGEIQYITTESEKNSPKIKSQFDEIISDNHPDGDDAPNCPLLNQYFQDELKDLNSKIIMDKIDKRDDFKLNKVDGKFTMFLTQNVPYIDSAMATCPKTKLSDGKLSMVLTKKGTSSLGTIKLFHDLVSSKEKPSNKIIIDKVTAFNLIPKEKGSFIALDGEKLDYSQILVEVHHGLINIFTLK